MDTLHKMLAAFLAFLTLAWQFMLGLGHIEPMEPITTLPTFTTTREATSETTTTTTVTVSSITRVTTTKASTTKVTTTAETGTRFSDATQEALTVLGESDTTVYQDVAATADGGFVACGITTSKTGPLASALNTSWKTPIGFVVKLNASLQPVWARCVGGTDGASMSLTGIAVLPDGGIVAVGSTDHSAYCVAAGFDAVLFKYDANGTLLWQKSFGGSGTDSFQCVSANGNGFVVGGSTYSYNGSFADLPASGSSAIFYQFDPDGNVLWKRYLNGSRGAVVAGIASDGDNNVFLAVTTVSKDGDFAGFDLKYSLLNSIVLKYDYQGTYQWNYPLASSAKDTFAAIAADGTGGCVVGGYYEFSGATGTPNGAFAGLHHCGGVDSLVFRLNADGTLCWTKVLSGLGDDYITDLDATSGGFVACGYTTSTNREFASIQNQGAEDAFTAFLTPGGVNASVRALGGGRSDAANCVACSGTKVVTLGKTGSNDGDFTANTWLTDGTVDQYAAYHSGVNPCAAFAAKYSVALKR